MSKEIPKCACGAELHLAATNPDVVTQHYCLQRKEPATAIGLCKEAEEFVKQHKGLVGANAKAGFRPYNAIAEALSLITRLVKFISDNDGILASANTDVKRMSEYADKLCTRLAAQDKAFGMDTSEPVHVTLDILADDAEKTIFKKIKHLFEY